VIKSFFHNSHFQEYKCSENNQTFIVYPRLATFIYAFTLISITLRAFLALQNPFKIKNVVYHVGLIGIFMMFLYLFPEILHFTLDGLNIRQLAICWGMGILVVAISELIRGLLNLIEEDKSYHFDLNISLGSKYNDYAQILREYQEGKAI
jgi:uncharacterized membrane protein YesL